MFRPRQQKIRLRSEGVVGLQILWKGIQHRLCTEMPDTDRFGNGREGTLAGWVYIKSELC
jgi:hypothetical protein